MPWLALPNFWVVMDHHQWVHLYNSASVGREFIAVPKHLENLKDDPFRNLAGVIRHAGRFAKDITPFSEFLWAEFFWGRITLGSTDLNLAKALGKAMKVARSQEASYLPSWSGVIARQ